jgi:hypothetical protein
LPKVKVAERSSEQGHATINDAVTEGKIFDGSFTPQYKAAPPAIKKSISVK